MAQLDVVEFDNDDGCRRQEGPDCEDSNADDGTHTGRSRGGMKATITLQSELVCDLGGGTIGRHCPDTRQ
jgi:hypothetical protein